jgi:hypothetical protein
MTPDVPRPVLAMPTSIAAPIRFVLEQCTNTLDDGAHGRTRASVTLAPIALPDGSTIAIRCSRTRAGRIHVTLSQKGAPE